jgi:uracil-DNA glycosylase
MSFLGKFCSLLQVLSMEHDLHALESEIRACQLCRNDMERAPNPILQVSSTARILIAGQAPGNLADLSGRPFTDPSGVRLRDWLGMDEETFYDASKVAIVPMGFCFPGYDKNGSDIPPMKRCAPTWRPQLMEALSQVELIILVGGYAQKWHLGSRVEKTLTATVANWRDYIDEGLFTTPHPSWRNTGWLKRNPWFEEEALPVLREKVQALL